MSNRGAASEWGIFYECLSVLASVFAYALSASNVQGAVVDPFVIDMEGIAPNEGFVNFDPPEGFPSARPFKTVLGFGDYELGFRNAVFIDRDIKPFPSDIPRHNSDWMIAYAAEVASPRGFQDVNAFLEAVEFRHGLEVERSDRAPFSLKSVDIAPADVPLQIQDTLVRVIGYTGDDTVSVNLFLPQFNFATFTVGDEFRDVDRVGFYPLSFEFNEDRNEYFMATLYSGIDNIRVSTGEMPHPIPVPASFLLLASALLPFSVRAWVRSRKSVTSAV